MSENQIQERPHYLDEDGRLDLSRLFQYQPKQNELRVSPCPQFLNVGGIRSGKTSGAMFYGVENFCLTFNKCDILVLRRTLKDLESGAIMDFKTFVPKELYKYNETKHVATFFNGSRVVFGHCQNNKERDIEQYLGQAYPYILVDECAQFSPDAWLLLNSRNTVNPGCEPRRDVVCQGCGECRLCMPSPRMVGCTNPFGAFWPYYHTTFVLQEPYEKVEGVKKDAVGRWWVEEAGEWRCEYNPDNFGFSHSTVLDNPKILARDPGIIDRLKAMPKGKRDKMLHGYMDKVEGQYFDIFEPEYHVINTREDRDAIIWQDWQPVWAGWDWGMAHWNAIYLFTKALVRKSVTDNYKLKTICFKEIIDQGKSNVEMVDILSRAARHPADGKPIKLNAIYFSHEKFNRQMEHHTPADELSRLLRLKGLVSVSAATKDRIASASFVYNLLKNGDLVILDTCPEIIRAIPNLMRDSNNLDDVLKVNSKADDAYDAFRYGLFGALNARAKPKQEVVREAAQKIEDPYARHWYVVKKNAEMADSAKQIKQTNVPGWMDRLKK